MYKFEIVKKGYNTLQVDNFISKEIEDYKQAVQDKNIRLQELLHQNADLKKQLQECRSREANVNQALVTAIEKSQEMEQIAKNSYNLELERLRVWRNKWIGYVENLKKSCKLTECKGEVIGILSSLEQELLENIKCGINLSYTKNLSEPEKQYNRELERIERKKEKTTDHDENFDELDKILSNPEFNDLIKSLGIA